MNGSGIRPMRWRKPTIDMCEDYLVIYDKKGTQIYIMTYAGAGVKHRDNDDQLSR